jgi:hypothetical protein
MSIPVWVFGVVIGGILGLVHGRIVRQMMLKNAQATDSAVPTLAKLIVAMETAAFAVAGGFVAHYTFGGN